MNYVVVRWNVASVKGRANEGEIYLYGRFSDFCAWLWPGWFTMCNEGGGGGG